MNRTRTKNKSMYYKKDEQIDHCSSAEMFTMKLLMTIHEADNVEGINVVIETATAVAYKLLNVGRVHVIMIKKDFDGKLMTSDSFEPEIDPSRGIAAVVAVTGKTLLFNDAKNDCRFKSGNDRVNNLMCVAIKSNMGEVIGVITVFNKNTDIGSTENFTGTDEFLLETIALNASVALFKSSVYQQTLREKRKFSALVHILRARTEPGCLDNILKHTVEIVCQLFNSNMVSIYLVDHVTNEAVICASNDMLIEGYTVNFGQVKKKFLWLLDSRMLFWFFGNCYITHVD